MINSLIKQSETGWENAEVRPANVFLDTINPETLWGDGAQKQELLHLCIIISAVCQVERLYSAAHIVSELNKVLIDKH